MKATRRHKLQTKSLLDSFHDNGKRQARQLDVGLCTAQRQIHNTICAISLSAPVQAYNTMIISSGEKITASIIKITNRISQQNNYHGEHTHTHTPFKGPFFRDYLGDAVTER